MHDLASADASDGLYGGAFFAARRDVERAPKDLKQNRIRKTRDRKSAIVLFELSMLNECQASEVELRAIRLLPPVLHVLMWKRFTRDTDFLSAVTGWFGIRSENLDAGQRHPCHDRHHADQSRYRPRRRRPGPDRHCHLGAHGLRDVAGARRKPVCRAAAARIRFFAQPPGSRSASWPGCAGGKGTKCRMRSIFRTSMTFRNPPGRPAACRWSASALKRRRWMRLR